MKNVILRLSFVISVGIFCCSCITNNNKIRYRHYKGHVTLAAGGSDFTTIDNQHRYLVTKDDMPESVYDYLKTQQPHTDLRSESDKSVSCYAEVEAILLYSPLYDPDDGIVRLHAVKVSKLLPASENYKKLRALSVMPEIETHLPKK
jgi:hypothetical protein